MAFNKWAYFTIKPGETFFIHYWFEGGPPNAECGNDHGAQYCMADPEAMPGILWVRQQGKERISVPTPHGTTGFIYFRYHVIVDYQAVENRSLDFTIQGGGLV